MDGIPPITLTAVTINSVTITWPSFRQWMPNAPDGGDPNTYSYIISPSDRDFETFQDIQSPLTVTNLSDSTRYTIQLIVSNENGTITTPPTPFVTKSNPSGFRIRTPVTTTVSAKSGSAVVSLTTTVLEWDGALGADTLTYSINPPDVFNRSSVTIPRNNKSPYCIADLDSNKTYTVTLSASITNAPGINGQPSVIDTVVSNESTFSTPPPRSMEIGTICGTLGADGKPVREGTVTNATKQPQSASITSVKNPRGVVLDKYGNLYVTSNSCVLKITPPKDNVYVYMRGEVPSIFLPTPHTTSNSSVTIYAGLADNNINSNYWRGTDPKDTTGDDIRFYNMSGMAYDSADDAIYISDSQLHVIIKLTSDSNGLVTSRVMGDKVKFARGHINGNVYTQARFDSPKGIAIGPDGSLFIADCYNHAVRRIYQDNVTTIAMAEIESSDDAKKNLLKSPYGVAVLYNGTVYVTSTWRHCIKKLTPNPDGVTYTISLFAGNDSDGGGDSDGKLLDARFNKPQGLFVDVNNNIYVYDAGNYKIKLISGGRVMTVFGGQGYRNGNKNDARLLGPTLKNQVEQADYGALTSDNNGNIYFSDTENGFLRCAFPEPPPIIDKATFDAFWQNRDESSAVAQTTSSAIAVGASASKIQRASSSLAKRVSSAVAQTVSTARSSSAREQRASSSVRSRESSAVAQQASTANASSALAQTVSSPLAQVASSAVAQGASTAQASSAVAQEASSAVAQEESSAVAQRVSSARESSAVAQDASSAVVQRESSAVAQRSSSALAQRASSARASSARELQALAHPVSVKDSIVKLIKSIQSDLSQQVALLYSRSSTQAEKTAAQEIIAANMPDLEGQWMALSQISGIIFAIAPMYQDRALQAAIYDDKYLDSKEMIKMYDFMRKKYIVIDSNGYIVSNIEPLKKRLH